MLSSGVLIIPSSVFFIALLLRLSFQSAFPVSRVTPLWSSLLINGVIIMIVVSWRFHHGNRDNQSGDGGDATMRQDGYHDPLEMVMVELGGALMYVEEKREGGGADAAEGEEESETAAVVEIPLFGGSDLDGGGRGKVISMRTDNSTEIPTESPKEEIFRRKKPLGSSGFDHRKRDTASSLQQGRTAMRVAKEEQNDTLENTWKMITEGSTTPLARHMKKSETFKDQTPNSPFLQPAKKPLMKPRREPPWSLEELTHRAEAFIKKFNDEIRLQRFESLKQYKQKILGRRRQT